MTLVGGRLLFVALMAFAPTACQTEDKGPQPRFVTDADGKPVSQAQDERLFVEFRSRYALSYGHTYVVFGILSQAGEMVNPEVAGLHPASNSVVPYAMGHFIPVPAETGWSDGDLEETYRSASWRVMLTQAEYNKVVAYIRKLQAKSHLWHAAVLNCNGFAADIARSMGYKTPAIQLRPQQFVTKLREMNT